MNEHFGSGQEGDYAIPAKYLCADREDHHLTDSIHELYPSP